MHVLADCLVLQYFMTPLLEQPDTDHLSLSSKGVIDLQPLHSSVPHVPRKPWPSPHPILLGEDEMEINISLQQLRMRPSWVSLAHQLLLQIIMNKFLSK